jgi:hypothetical protein
VQTFRNVATNQSLAIKESEADYRARKLKLLNFNATPRSTKSTPHQHQ